MESGYVKVAAKSEIPVGKMKSEGTIAEKKLMSLQETLFGIAVSVLFGWYPARKAAKMHPVQALRYE